MKINSISLNNFKCFDKVKIDLSKITLLTGANSSGKSSLIYSLIGAIQSREFPLQFSPNGKYVNMGDYNEIVLSHDSQKEIMISFNIDKSNSELNEEIKTYWIKQKINNLPILQKLEATGQYYKITISKSRKYNLNFEYNINNDPISNFRSPEMMNKLLDSLTNLLNENLADEDKNNNILKKYTNLKSKFEFKFTNLEDLNKTIQEKGNYYLDNIFKSIIDFFKKFDDNTNYISSFRLFPERTYYETSKKELKVGKFGENYEDQIILWETNRDDKFQELLSILKKLDLLHDIKSNRISGGRFELLIKSKKDGIWSSLSDVGFGISQFLPIIVADLQLGNNSLLSIAQPEIHLHPKVQAHFADYIIEQISTRNKRYIIETHSEYLLNRIRLGICEEKVEETDINTYYIENNGFLANIYSINLLKNGQIKNAPESFFDTYMMDVMNIAISAK